MSHIKTKSFFLSIFLLFTILLATAEENLVFKWSYKADGTIYSVNQDDINNDSYAEVLFASAKKLYVFDRNGNSEKTYELNSKGNPYVLKTAELSNNSKTKEIVLGFGWVERIPVDRVYLNATVPGGGITTIPVILYENALNLGEMQTFNTTSLTSEKKVDGWIRAISIADVDSDESNELVVVTGGENTLYYELFSTQPISNESEEQNETVGKPGNETTENETETEDEEFSDWMSKETYEEHLLKSSIFIFSQNFTTKTNRSYDLVFWDADTGNLYSDGDMEIIAGASDTKLYSFSSMNLTTYWEYESPGEVRTVWVGDLQDDGIPEEIITYKSAKVSGIQGVTRDGSKFLDFRTPLGENLKTIAIGKLDQDIEKEIFLSTDRNLYVLDLDGRIKLRLQLAGTDKIVVSDSNKDNISKLFLTKDSMLYCYEFSGKISKKKTADELCENAKETELVNFTLARFYAEEALLIYREINDTEKLEECSLLLSEIISKINAKKKTEADTFYANAISNFAFKDYEKAHEYTKKALEIYLEINDSEGIKNSKNLIAKIEEKLNPSTTTAIQITSQQTTTVTLPVTTTIKQQSNGEIPARYLAITAAVIIVLLSALFLIWKRKEREEEKELEDLSKIRQPDSNPEEEQ